MSNKYILLVEDNPDEVLLTERAFSICNLSENLMVVRNGQEALDFLFDHSSHYSAFSAEKPSAVLLDLNLPKISGLEALSRIKANTDTSKIPVIILTSSTDDRDISASQRLGAQDYIKKPTSFSDFVQIIRSLKSKWIDN